MYVPSRSSGKITAEGQLQTIVARVLKDARIQRAFQKAGIREGAAVVRPVAKAAFDAAIIKAAAQRAVRDQLQKERGPVRYGGFYVR